MALGILVVSGRQSQFDARLAQFVFGVHAIAILSNAVLRDAGHQHRFPVHKTQSNGAGTTLTVGDRKSPLFFTKESQASQELTTHSPRSNV